ncbi:hypothetical protein NIES2109_59910 (plasmid) [Nostoc sp. HK-01]|nr:hypothetical protein NIES2109_59910 [Nostoc sp. HK-01]
MGEEIEAKSYPTGAVVTTYPPALRLVIKELKRG